MSKPTRKPLGESLAENFVYGKSEPASPSSPASKDLPIQEKEETLMSRLLEAPNKRKLLFALLLTYLNPRTASSRF